MKYFIFNKDMDYIRGMSVNLDIAGGAIRARDPAPGKPGIFLSRALDSRDQGNQWHRLVMDVDLGENIAVYLNIYATDSQSDMQRLEDWRIRMEKRYTDEERAEAARNLGERMLDPLTPLLKATSRNPEDILLDQVEGRYLWIALILHGNGKESPTVRRIRVDFPKETWMRFLPEIYQGEQGGFLERYLCIFQSIYDDMNMDIQRDALLLDIHAAPPEFLQWLSGWICAADPHLWRPERLRQYLEQGASVYQRLGTPGTLERMVEIYTGLTPYLKEAEPGDNPHAFYLYVQEESVATPRRYQALLRVIREGKPANMEVQVIALKPYVFLNQNTYLGINSRLNQYGQAVLDSGASIPYAVLGGRED